MTVVINHDSPSKSRGSLSEPRLSYIYPRLTCLSAPAFALRRNMRYGIIEDDKSPCTDFLLCVSDFPGCRFPPTSVQIRNSPKLVTLILDHHFRRRNDSLCMCSLVINRT